MADSVTRLRAAGPAGTKKNLVILGDGFTAADQAAYNTWVDTTVMQGVFAHDYFLEDASAWNIYRVNLESADSGVSTRTYDLHGTPDDASDDTIASQTTHNTPLAMIFNGSWAHCWLEYGTNTEALITTALDTWVPDHDFVLVVLNNPSFGGCGGGGRAHVPMGVGWETIAHEFGHGLGSLGDEYSVTGAWGGGGEPVNLTADSNRATTKWRQFIAPTTPVPTGVGSGASWNQGPRPATWDSNTDVGLFEGGGTVNTGVYRPVEDCRMKSNSPAYCPVCYTSFKQQYDHNTGHDFLHCVPGRFSGNGRSDLLVHADNSIQIFRSNGSQLDHSSSAVERVPGSWQFKPHDQFFVGDFNGDGVDEVAVFNGVDWAIPYLGLLVGDGSGGLRLIARYDGDIPGWGGFARHDHFLVADFNGDGRDDLVVWNGDDWSMTYVAMLRSTGSGFTMSRRFDGDIPGWGGLARHDQFFVADLGGDGKDDLVILNGVDWSMTYVGLFRSTGSTYSMTARFDGDIPGWGGLASHDQVLVGDFDGDGRDDLFIFNGDDWSMSYLGMFRSTGSSLSMVARYDGDVPGWGGLARHDRFFPADISGDGRTDLFAFNSDDWSEEYLGRMVSTGTGLQASFTGDWVGEWNLGPQDRFEVANLAGGTGEPNLYVHNKDWFGIITGRRSLSLQRIHFRWIHNYRFGRNW